MGVMAIKIYISGPMTGIKDYNYPAFNSAEKELKIMGYKTFNPARIKSDKDWTWQDYMRECIKALPDCDKIYMLKGWENSKGAKIERSIAKTLGIEIIYER